MKIKYWIIFILFLISACVADTKKRNNVPKPAYDFIPMKEYLQDEINIDFVKNQFGKELYFDLFKKAVDTIAKRQKQNLKENPTLKIYVDSMICINSSKDKIIFFECFLNSSDELDADFKYIYGKKINGNWYFFGGATQPLYKPKNRHNTRKDVHKWIKKYTLGYLKRDSKGNLLINDEFFVDFDRLEGEPSRSEYPRNKLEKNRIFIVNSMQEFYENKMVHEVYKPTDFSFKYDKSKEELTITCPIKKWNKFPVGYSFYWERMEKKFDYNDFEKNQIFIPMNQNTISTTIKNIKSNDEFGFVINFVARNTISGVGKVFYKFKLQNGKAKFIGLVPDEADIRTYDAPRQDSIRKVWQKRIDERLGKNYGK